MNAGSGLVQDEYHPNYPPIEPPIEFIISKKLEPEPTIYLDIRLNERGCVERTFVTRKGKLARYCTPNRG